MARKELMISTALIAEWRQEHDRLRAEIDHKLAEATRLSERIKAAEILLPTEDSGGGHKPNGSTDDAENMTAVIEKIANGITQPISHGQMRDELRRRGFPEDRLGNYYYTAAHRLKRKGRISINADGKIWGAGR